MRWDTHVQRYKSEVHAHAKKRAPTENRAAGGLAATGRLLQRRGALPMVAKTADESARRKPGWGPEGARQRAR